MILPDAITLASSGRDYRPALGQLDGSEQVAAVVAAPACRSAGFAYYQLREREPCTLRLRTLWFPGLR